MGADDEATQLADAAKLPWEDRFKHTFWKARVAAYECVVKEAKLSEDIASSACLKTFGECRRESAAPDPASRRRPGDCLLYTSPSPRDMRRSRMPSSA